MTFGGPQGSPPYRKVLPRAPPPLKRGPVAWYVPIAGNWGLLPPGCLKPPNRFGCFPSRLSLATRRAKSPTLFLER
jgi:hypothetical protein